MLAMAAVWNVLNFPVKITLFHACDQPCLQTQSLVEETWADDGFLPVQPEHGVSLSYPEAGESAREVGARARLGFLSCCDEVRWG